jgi:hypothetical protein
MPFGFVIFVYFSLPPNPFVLVEAGHSQAGSGPLTDHLPSCSQAPSTASQVSPPRAPRHWFTAPRNHAERGLHRLEHHHRGLQRPENQKSHRWLYHLELWAPLARTPHRNRFEKLVSNYMPKSLIALGDINNNISHDVGQ